MWLGFVLVHQVKLEFYHELVLLVKSQTGLEGLKMNLSQGAKSSQHVHMLVEIAGVEFSN